MSTSASYVRKASFFWASFFCVLVLPGCDWKQFLGIKVKPQVEARSKTLEVSTERTPEQRNSFYLWVVNEIFEQALVEKRPVAELSKWANVLAQRGSLEGVYHGIVYSTDYASKERGQASVKAIRFVAVEMALMDFPSEEESHEKVKKAAESYAQLYMASSLFTLKRLMGERILKEISKFGDNSDSLAKWFAVFAYRWGKLGVDFGSPQRIQSNQDSYFRWAEASTVGLIQWELLNRAHRVLNHLGNITTRPSGT